MSAIYSQNVENQNLQKNMLAMENHVTKDSMTRRNYIGMRENVSLWFTNVIDAKKHLKTGFTNLGIGAL